MSAISQNTDNFFQHMYSKAGKASTQIFAHLLGKANKYEQTQRRSSDDQNKITISTPLHSPKKQPQPFSLCLSREYVLQLKNAGKQTVSLGMYNPKYSVIQKKSDIGGKFSQEHKQSLRQNESRNSIETVSSIQQKKRIKGFIELKRQLSREQSNQLYNISQNTTQNQFLSLDTTQTRPRPRSAHFKGSGHSMNINKFNCFQSFYDADFSVGRRKISFVGASFEKQTQRKSNLNKSVCLREESIYVHDQFSQKNSIVHPNTKNVMIDFKKILGRSQRNESAIPSHMSKTNRSRIMLETLNQKMLELNATVNQ